MYESYYSTRSQSMLSRNVLVKAMKTVSFSSSRSYTTSSFGKTKPLFQQSIIHGVVKAKEEPPMKNLEGKELDDLFKSAVSGKKASSPPSDPLFSKDDVKEILKDNDESKGPSLRTVVGDDYDAEKLIKSLHPETLQKLALDPELLAQILDGSFKLPESTPIPLGDITSKTYIPPLNPVRKVSDADLEHFRPYFNNGDNSYSMVPALGMVFIIFVGFIGYQRWKTSRMLRDVEQVRAERLAEVLALEAAAKAEADALIAQARAEGIVLPSSETAA